MISPTISNVYHLGRLKWEIQEQEVDSPLAGVRVYEREECYRKFGRIKIYFSSANSLEPIIEKSYDPDENIQNQSCYFFLPKWRRVSGDPYRDYTYRVQLVNWKLKNGNQMPSSHQEIILRSILNITANSETLSAV